MKAKQEIRVKNRLRRHRLLADGVTQQDLAEKVGVTRQTILAIERGNYNPSVGLALRLAQAGHLPYMVNSRCSTVYPCRMATLSCSRSASGRSRLSTLPQSMHTSLSFGPLPVGS